MLVEAPRELRSRPCVILHVPHGERAVVQISLEVMFRGRSPFLTMVCSSFQDVAADIHARYP